VIFDFVVGFVIARTRGHGSSDGCRMGLTTAQGHRFGRKVNTSAKAVRKWAHDQTDPPAEKALITRLDASRGAKHRLILRSVQEKAMR
jgi:hypothetical protein